MDEVIFNIKYKLFWVQNLKSQYLIVVHITTIDIFKIIYFNSSVDIQLF